MREMAKRFTEVLALENHIIALRYSARAQGEQRRAAACGALGMVAKEGATVTLSADNSQCPGGSYYLGLAERRAGIEEFLVEEEHIFETYPLARRYFETLPEPPLGLRPYVNMCPLDEATEEPDLVIFTTNAAVAGRLLGLVAYSRSPWQMHAFGAACFCAVTGPLMKDRPEVSFIDISARRRSPFTNEELLVSLPWQDCQTAHRNIDKSVCGTYEFRL